MYYISYVLILLFINTRGMSDLKKKFLVVLPIM